jgi:hypothetical protein
MSDDNHDYDDDDFFEFKDEEVEKAREEQEASRRVAPNGTYLMQVDEVYTKDKDGNSLKDSHGHRQWNLWMRIVRDRDGSEEFQGVRVADRMFFGGKAMLRAADIAEAFGFDMKAQKKLTPAFFRDKCAFVQIRVGEYEGRKRNEPVYSGYTRYDGPMPDAPTEHATAGAGAESEDDAF